MRITEVTINRKNSKLNLKIEANSSGSDECYVYFFFYGTRWRGNVNKQIIILLLPIFI